MILYLIRNLIVIPILILLVLLASVIIGTIISELLYPLAEMGLLDIP